MRFGAFTAWLGAFLLSFLAIATRADTISLHPSADATLFEVAQSNSAGGAIFFNAGKTQNGPRARALIQFDIASAVPAGSHINSVSLELEVVRRPGCGFEVGTFGLHRLLRSWGEGTTVPTENPGGMGAPASPGDATWTHRFVFTDPWAAPGGAAGTDYAQDFSSSIPIYDVGVYQFESTADAIKDAQFWLDNPQLNFGWMLRDENEDLPFTARRFTSREDPGGGPLLTIDFTVVPEPNSLALFAVGLVMCAVFYWRKRKRH